MNDQKRAVGPAGCQRFRSHPQLRTLRSLLLALTFAGGLWFPTVSYGETSLTVLRNETRQLLIHEAAAESVTARQDAATALCDLYIVLRSDPRYESSRMLQGDAMKIRRRLIRLARDETNRLQREGIERPGDLDGRIAAALAEAKSQRESGDAITTASPASTTLSPKAAAGGAAVNGGWELVELIQRVIAPDFWDRRGGPGTVHYFALRRVLVVRATSDVHQQIKDLLMALR